jgi:predicted RNase H-like HicB family nuclease
MKLKIVIHPEKDGGFSVAVPALPGCYSCADTLEEALANIREAAEGWLAVANERQPFEPEDRSGEDIVQEIEL